VGIGYRQYTEIIKTWKQQKKLGREERGQFKSGVQGCKMEQPRNFERTF